METFRQKGGYGIFYSNLFRSPWQPAGLQDNQAVY